MLCCFFFTNAPPDLLYVTNVKRVDLFCQTQLLHYVTISVVGTNLHVCY